MLDTCPECGATLDEWGDCSACGYYPTREIEPPDAADFALLHAAPPFGSTVHLVLGTSMRVIHDFPDAQALAARLATNCVEVAGDCLICDLFDDCEALSPDREE